MSELLQEYVDSGSHKLRVDRTAGVIRGVKLLGLRSRNGRRYEQSALAEAVSLYEGAKVNVNHPKGHPLAPRDYQDRLGVISGVEFRQQEGLFGDLHFNPKHALSEQLMWDAEHASQNVGLSHNVLARTTQQGDDTVVEAITKVQSIDLVADPATTQGLFEQEVSTRAIDWDLLTLEELRLHRPDLHQELLENLSVERTSAEMESNQSAAREAVLKRWGQIVELLQEHHLPLPGGRHDASRHLVGRQFVESLLDAKDDAALTQLVRERAALVRLANSWTLEHGQPAVQPVSRDQLALTSAHGCACDAKQFAAAICGR
jgi:hypothetical protein